MAHGGRAGHGEGRAGVDDPAELAPLHPRNDGLDREERAFDVGAEHAVEERLIDLLDVGVHAADAGVVDQDIDAAERLLGGRNRGLHLGDDPVVGLKAQHLDFLALRARPWRCRDCPA